MKHAIRILAAAAIAAGLPAVAVAQSGPQYSADQVLEHFSLPKGNTRAVCIGTAAECAKQQPPQVADAGAFDLLVTFEFGSDRLSSQAQANLREFARALKDPALSGARFNVDGHTDSVGSDSFNQMLSERRAKAVVEFLEALGVSPERLKAEGFGERELRDAEHPKAGINRRVEATLSTP